jgi:hypothetical protein
MNDISPEEQRLAEQGRVAVAAAMARTHAPLGLRERIEADRSRPVRTRRRRVLLAPAATLAALAAIVVLGLALHGDRGTIGGGRAGGPTVLALATLADRGATTPAPSVDAARPQYLDAAVDAVRFPRYGGTVPWSASGARADRVSGAPARTVFYRGPGGRPAAYTIVAGTRLPVPAGARIVRRGGVAYRVARTGGRVLVAWERQGHTCVLSAPAAVGRDALLRLAWWRA